MSNGVQVELLPLVADRKTAMVPLVVVKLLKLNVVDEMSFLGSIKNILKDTMGVCDDEVCCLVH